jgi:hypothetical protein
MIPGRSDIELLERVLELNRVNRESGMDQDEALRKALIFVIREEVDERLSQLDTWFKGVDRILEGMLTTESEMAAVAEYVDRRMAALGELARTELVEPYQQALEDLRKLTGSKRRVPGLPVDGGSGEVNSLLSELRQQNSS